jgi:uncharacterized lipoprotein YmbA
MKKIPAVLGLLLILLLAFVGCGGVRQPHYYTLNLPAPPDPPAKDGVRTSIAVREFQAPGYLRQGPIVYRSAPEQLGFYEYHRWAEDPRTLVTGTIVDYLRASGQYSAVSMYNGRSDNDFIFSGKLEKLEEVDSKSGVKVEVAISAQITRVKTGATVWSNAVSEAASVSQRNLPGVVSQMNRTMQIAIDKLLASIPATLANN